MHGSRLLLLTAVACAAVPVPQPTDPDGRLRFTVTGRADQPNLTSVDYQMWLTVRGPDGRLQLVALNVLATSSAESIAGGFAVRISSIYDAPVPTVAALPQRDAPVASAEFQLPEGLALDCRRGCFYAYRFDRQRQRKVADLAPEIRVTVLNRDGKHAVELEPTAGPELSSGELPPGRPQDGR